MAAMQASFEAGQGGVPAAFYEAGNFVMADWRARLEDHLGSYTCELLKSNAALVLDLPLRLAASVQPVL